MNDSLGNLSRGVKFGTFTFFGTLIYEPQFRLSCEVTFSTFCNQLGGFHSKRPQNVSVTFDFSLSKNK